MALRSFVSRTPVRRLMEGTRISGLRYFGDGGVFTEEERAAENVYNKKMERERMKKLKQKAEKEKAEKEKAEKFKFLEVIDRERCKLVSVVTNGVLKLSIQARFHGILIGTSHAATGFIISDSGHFVTNLHCISEACRTIKGSRIPFHVFEFGYSVPRVGQSIFTLGNPSCCPNTTRFGFVADVGFSVNNLTEDDAENVVVSWEYVPKNFEYILLDLNAASGFSGGPSCDVKGRVISITQSTSSGDYEYFNLSVPVKYLWALILKHMKLGLRGYINGDDKEKEGEKAQEIELAQPPPLRLPPQVATTTGSHQSPRLPESTSPQFLFA
ncbi:hypothetical protein Vadar_030310 [Vaccinium darrowii]|uniref:Uncharacterized protein n=1 Tax=Vaccinium darrowii TaxID=229202 RepID=A0ACB7XL00_9ERIC|nr:hypothetical protein Vadar_030310 [Vaccinium darrowii]